MPGDYMQLNPVVAFNGRVHLAVWEEWRNVQASDIRGARVAQDNSLLDSNGLVISAAPANQANAAITVLDTTFYVVWEDYRNHKSDIYGTRVCSNGTVLDSEGVRISNSGNTAQNPAIASGTGCLLAVWQEAPPDSGPHIVAARLTPAYCPIDTAPIRVSFESGSQSRPRVSFNPESDYFVAVWESRTENGDSVLIRAARIGSNGLVLDSPSVRICTLATRQTEPDIAWSRSTATAWKGFLVVWQDNRLDSLSVGICWIDSLFRIENPSGFSPFYDRFSEHHPRVSAYREPYSYLDFNYYVCFDQLEYNGQHVVHVGALSDPSHNYGQVWGTWGMSNYLWGGVYSDEGYDVGIVVMNSRPGSSTSTVGVARDFYYITGVHDALISVAASSLHLTPELTSTSVRLDWSNPNRIGTELRILDLAGRTWKKLRLSCVKPGPQSLELNVGDLAQGIYFVQVRTGGSALTGHLEIIR